MEELTKDEMMNIYGGLGLFGTVALGIVRIFLCQDCYRNIDISKYIEEKLG